MSNKEENLKQIKAILADLGWCQKDLADASGVHQASLSPILSGRRDITLKTFYRITEALGAEVIIQRKKPQGKK